MDITKCTANMLVNAKTHMPFQLPRNNLVGHELGSHSLQLRAGHLSGERKRPKVLPTRNSPNLPVASIEASLTTIDH